MDEIYRHSFINTARYYLSFKCTFLGQIVACKCQTCQADVWLEEMWQGCELLSPVVPRWQAILPGLGTEHATHGKIQVFLVVTASYFGRAYEL